MKSRPAISIIGTGAVGSALLDFFQSEDYTIRSYWNSRQGFLYDGNRGTYTPAKTSFPSEEAELGDWIFITTPDNRIGETCRKLAGLDLDWSKKSVIHCSGSMTSGECLPLSEKGAAIASIHPLQTFTRGDSKERLKEIHISLEGDKTLTQQFKKVVREMGATPVELSSSQKQTLHIAAVFASNYFISLMCTAENLLKEEGIENGLNILEPLIRQTLDNIFEQGVQQSLTGPVSRGDDIVIKEHLSRLQNSPDRRRLYQLLGREALQLAVKQNRLTDVQVEKLKMLLVE